MKRLVSSPVLAIISMAVTMFTAIFLLFMVCSYIFFGNANKLYSLSSLLNEPLLCVFTISGITYFSYLAFKIKMYLSGVYGKQDETKTELFLGSFVLRKLIAILFLSYVFVVFYLIFFGKSGSHTGVSFIERSAWHQTSFYLMTVLFIFHLLNNYLIGCRNGKVGN